MVSFYFLKIYYLPDFIGKIFEILFVSLSKPLMYSMKHKYLIVLFLIGFLMFAAPANAQQADRANDRTELPIDGLSIYPNPVTGGKVYISSTKNQDKIIEIFNVLGKSVHKTRIRGREMDVSTLTPGIYILKIQEGKGKATRKLVIK